MSEELEDDLFDDVLNEADMLTPGDRSTDLLGMDDDPAPSNRPHDPKDGLPMPDINSLVADEEDEVEDPIEEGEDTEELTEANLIEQLLAAKGIKGTTILFENDEGNEEEVDFYSLSAEEQLAILNSNDSDINFGLEDEEINTVNFLRQNNVSFEEAIDYYKKQAVQEYLDSQSITGIEVDQYTDEELFAIDLKAKFDTFTEEEIDIELQKQLEHPELFKKKIDKLRTDYRQIEEDQLEAARLQEERDQEQKTTELRNNLVSVAEGVAEIGGLDLDNNDKNEVLSYILDKDMNGMSPFIKALDSPKQLFELAWYATKGREAFDIIHDYYKKEIDKVNKAAFAKGKESVTKKVEPSKPARTSYRRPNPSHGQRATPEDYPSMDDILKSQL